MQVDVLLDPFAARWAQVADAAGAAEDLGFAAVWTWDHLAGGVHRAPHVEAWTVLSALAARTTRLQLGPLVLNVANRDPGTLAVAAATLQEVSDGRLLLGLGAGGGIDTPYAVEQRALGRPVPPGPQRLAALADGVARLRAVRADAGGHGFLRPVPPPPIVLGGFGAAVARLAGGVTDGFNTAAGHPRLADLAAARARAAGRPFAVSAFCGDDPRWYRSGGPGVARLLAAGVDRVVVIVPPPYRIDVLRRIAADAGLAQP